MEWIIENWFVLVALAAVVFAATLAGKFFMDLPTPKQIEQIKEWLLWAVTVAEAELGSGTGQLKLRFVYDMFIERFPLFVKVISFDMFRKWVDEALVKMKELLANSPAVAAFVEPVKTEE